MKTRRVGLIVGIVAGMTGALLGAWAGDLSVDNVTVNGKLQVSKMSAGSAATSGLILYYSFNTNESGVVSDLSGNNYTGTVFGATWSTNALGAGCYVYDGVNDGIQSSLTSMEGKNLTLSAWIKVDSFYGSTYMYGIVGTVGGPTGYQMIRLGGNGTVSQRDLLTFAFYNGSTYPQLAGTTHMATGTWYHVAATYDGAYMRLYVNGVQDNYVVQTSSMTSGQNYVLAQDASIRWLNGAIDEVRIYNRALSPQEIEDLYLYNRPVAVTEGEAEFNEGIKFLKPLGDLSMGSFTNQP